MLKTLSYKWKGDCILRVQKIKTNKNVVAGPSIWLILVKGQLLINTKINRYVHINNLNFHNTFNISSKCHRIFCSKKKQLKHQWSVTKQTLIKDKLFRHHYIHDPFWVQVLTRRQKFVFLAIFQNKEKNTIFLYWNLRSLVIQTISSLVCGTAKGCSGVHDT